MSLWGQGEKISIKIPDTSKKNDILILGYEYFNYFLNKKEDN